MICPLQATQTPAPWRKPRNICAPIFRLQLSYGMAPGESRALPLAAALPGTIGNVPTQPNPKRCYD